MHNFVLERFYRRTDRAKRCPFMDTTRWLKESPVIVRVLFAGRRSCRGRSFSHLQRGAESSSQKVVLPLQCKYRSFWSSSQGPTQSKTARHLPLGGFYRRTHRSRRHPCMDTTRWLKESPVIIISLFPQKECFVLVKVLVFVVRALRRPPQVFSPQQIKIPPQNSRQEIGQEQNKHHEDEKARDKQQEEPLHPHHHLQQQQHHQQHYGAASS